MKKRYIICDFIAGFFCEFWETFPDDTCRYAFVYCVRNIFRNSNISYPMTRIRTCAYHGVIHDSFLENFAYVLNWIIPYQISSNKLSLLSQKIYVCFKQQNEETKFTEDRFTLCCIKNTNYSNNRNIMNRSFLVILI